MSDNEKGKQESASFTEGEHKRGPSENEESNKSSSSDSEESNQGSSSDSEKSSQGSASANEPKPYCQICAGAGSYGDGYFMDDSMPYEHGYCKDMLSSGMSTLDAGEKLKTLQLPQVWVPYSFVTVAIKEKENNDAILAKVCTKLKEEMKNVQDNELFVMDPEKLSSVTEEKAKRTIAHMYFYDYYKYICVNNRRCEWGKRDVDPEYQDACRIVYYALGLNTQSSTLKDQCLNVLRKLEADSASEAAGSLGEGTGPEGEEDVKRKRVTRGGVKGATNASDGSQPPVLPKELAKEVDGIKYFHGQKLCAIPEDLDADELLVAINQPCGMAVGVYAYYSRYNG